jgi:hypothetical protein
MYWWTIAGLVCFLVAVVSATMFGLYTERLRWLRWWRENMGRSVGCDTTERPPRLPCRKWPRNGKQAARGRELERRVRDEVLAKQVASRPNAYTGITRQDAIIAYRVALLAGLPGKE